MAKTALIIDDSTSMRQLVEYTLKGAGFDVIVAVNGKDALAKSAGAKLDIVVTDLNMPEMDGITFIKEFRATPGHRFTPVIMLTTESQASKQEEGKKAGASGWIVKPFKPEKLLEAAAKFVK